MSNKTKAIVLGFKKGIAGMGRDKQGNPKNATVSKAKAKFLKRSMHQTIANGK